MERFSKGVAYMNIHISRSLKRRAGLGYGKTASDY